VVAEGQKHPALAEQSGSHCPVLRLGAAMGISGGVGVSKPRQHSLRILALVTDAFGGPGGIAEYNRHLLMALADCSRVQDIIVLPRNAKPFDASRLTPGIKQLAPVSGKITYSAAAICRAIKHRPVDVIFCGHLFMAPLAEAIAKVCHAKLWIQLHGTDAWPEANALQRRSFERADFVTSVSRYTRRRVLQWASIDPAKVKVLPNTYDDRFLPRPKPTHLMERYGLAGKKVLMTVSRLASNEKYKGQDRVIAVLQRLMKRHPDLVYLIIGEGDDKPRLEALAIEQGVDDCVRFLPGVSASELVETMNLADVFVMPSTGEGFGIVFLEAMASGVPVIGGNQDGSVDPLADGVLGTAIDPYSADELVAAIFQALEQKTPTADAARRFSHSAFKLHVYGLVNSALFFAT
jgi:phosphatidylinositol alpha-1,6-mannosyltransferase